MQLCRFYGFDSRACLLDAIPAQLMIYPVYGMPYPLHRHFVRDSTLFVEAPCLTLKLFSRSSSCIRDCSCQLAAHRLAPPPAGKACHCKRALAKAPTYLKNLQRNSPSSFCNHLFIVPPVLSSLPACQHHDPDWYLRGRPRANTVRMLTTCTNFQLTTMLFQLPMQSRRRMERIIRVLQCAAKEPPIPVGREPTRRSGSLGNDLQDALRGVQIRTSLRDVPTR